MTAPSSIEALVRGELLAPVDARVAELGEAIAARHGEAARAVLFYGSCLRESWLDGLMLDFYLIVSDYRAAYGPGWYAFANRVLPPNVFPFQHGGLAAKYAVLSEADFARETSLRARSVSVWARFAQPSRLVWARDDAARGNALAAVAQAAPTLFELTLPMMAAERDRDVLDIWTRGFSLTYGAELRAERKGRPRSIVDTDPERYRRFGHAALGEIARTRGVGADGEVPLLVRPDRMTRRWRGMSRKGKALSLARLAKAITTFDGGADYLVWKINRHAGTQIELKPWQRRWPLAGSLVLLPRLLRQGAVR